MEELKKLESNKITKDIIIKIKEILECCLTTKENKNDIKLKVKDILDISNSTLSNMKWLVLEKVKIWKLFSEVVRNFDLESDEYWPKV